MTLTHMDSKRVPKFAIFDLDHTVCDPAHRIHFFDEDPPNWHAFEAAAGGDAPIPATVFFIQSLIKTGYDVRFWTARPESYRANSLDWLVRIVSRSISDSKLRMRTDAESQYPAYILKGRWLKQLTSNPERDVFCAFDDDLLVCDMYHKAGVLTYHARSTGWSKDAKRP